MNINKTVFIVGASRGIGKSLAYIFAKNNWNLFLVSRNLDELQMIKDELISKYSIQCEISQLDITKYDDHLIALEKCKQVFPQLDLVVLNSGISESVKISELDLDVTRKIFETNFFGILSGLQIFVDYFKNQKFGKIAIVSSLADARGYPGSSVYAASKAAISHITEAARIELKSLNIDVIAIKPGFVITDMTSKHKFRMPFLMTAEKSAQIIFSGLMKNKKRIYYPLSTTFLSYLIKIIPGFMFDFLMRFWKGENSNL
jgi:short-subunit dehydrogenase